MIKKEEIANICEDLYKECLREIPQYENNELLWVLNGSTLCNFLYNVVTIDGNVVSEEFNKACYEFIRKPKGDIDILYKADRPYKFDFNSEEVKRFQEISEEQRTYNFVDSNNEISEKDIKELCMMETKSGLKFMAKKPQYLFLYKFKELLAVFSNEIMNNDTESITNKKKNIIHDVISLYKIAIIYCGEKELEQILIKLPEISETLNKIHNANKDEYFKLINHSLKIINSLVNKKINIK